MSGIIAGMVLLLNKKARTEYSIEQTYTCGIVLIGSEVKSLRNKSGSLSG
ncbi:SsrA-binding protein, partial [Candidatus Woesebacteria bacterium]|nr:SsrA-binding protein [Candidatus Woesebacteria bacterium]